MGGLFRRLCQSVCFTIYCSICAIPCVQSVFLSSLGHDFYRNLKKIHASEVSLAVKRKLEIIQSFTKLQWV